MRAEVDKLKAIGFIREATYPVWLANSVMVRKARGGWRMCQDYTDLNKACPKDSLPLPRIDQLVDATAGHELLSFMDAYSGYNQIFMNPADREHTAFITDRGLYCYNVMPFGLKNAGQLTNGSSTNQRGIEANPEKIKAIIDMETPKTQKDIQSLTGRVAALTRFISKATDKCAYEIRQIPRAKTSHADALSRLASAINDKIERKVPVEILSQPSTTAAEVCTVEYEDTWMSPIYVFLTTETLPTDKTHARKLRY
ncbi:PREDICTED: uncharacterized protein LOC107880912 [Prunus mume]|uniref:Uncharacterized protein LOC107880912 n=1 Tax=Prunus mume TaxID=102107 RepID=A0ABM1LNG0_PRUMU|nr:PREDICTED: uncharacterized protein LOC107880912 [Prunus mume]